MKLTRGEFCQFNLKSRFELLREFGKGILEKKLERRVVYVYRIFDFYVEVSENSNNQKLERVEPVTSMRIIELYRDFL